MTDTATSTNTNTPSKEFNLWHAYSVCLLVSFIFFLLFGFNSPLYKFNSDPDYNWFMTTGNGLTNGKIPYRDLFDHKGPIVYFVYGFCCLFPNPRLVIFLIEIISMSLFFFFAYRIAKLFLNTSYSLLIVPILAFIVFNSANRVTNASCIEEFCLPILTYFLFCWLEFLSNKKQWNWIRSICLGICFGIIFWSKFTIFCFILTPMIIWLTINLSKRNYRLIITNLIFVLIGIIIISIPIIFFYIKNNALDDLFHVYIYINIFIKTRKFDLTFFMDNFKHYFSYNLIITILISYVFSRFTIRHWHQFKHYIAISLITTFICLIYIYDKFNYYLNTLIPFTIFAIIEILECINTKLSTIKRFLLIFTILTFSCIIVVLPLSILPFEITREKEEYIPLVIADVIRNYENQLQRKMTLFCYKIPDLGLYNAKEISPNNYFFAYNNFSIEQLPEMYEAYNNTITNQTSDFIITSTETWRNENDLLSIYYQPITGFTRSSSYNYFKLSYNYHTFYKLIVLKKI